MSDRKEYVVKPLYKFLSIAAKILLVIIVSTGLMVVIVMSINEMANVGLKGILFRMTYIPVVVGLFLALAMVLLREIIPEELPAARQ
ncbi:MAG: hypothetical protein Q4P66_04480 [Actinomycetaceae bacterium]|nr:hypothetical protein [Actinomycetaceae bacterium]